MSGAAVGQVRSFNRLITERVGARPQPGGKHVAMGTHNALLHFAQASLHDARGQKWKQAQYPVLIENALRHLIAVSPDVQTS